MNVGGWMEWKDWDYFMIINWNKEVLMWEMEIETTETLFLNMNLMNVLTFSLVFSLRKGFITLNTASMYHG
jgi:hypothetical protein